MRVHRARPLVRRARVSVVIPCYNYGHYLPGAVASALDQPGLDVEVVIVDDCSPDGSGDVADLLAARHEGVRSIRNPVNRRHIATYNVGLAEATGDYVALLSADDLLAPGALTRAVALFEAHPSVSIVYGQAVTFTDAPPAPAPAARTWSTWRGESWLAHSCRNTGNLIVNPEAVLRRDVLERFGGYDATLPHAADMLLWLQAASLGDVGRVNGVQAYYREHGANMHLTDYAGTLTDLRERVAVFDRLLGEGGTSLTPGRAHALRESARRQMAREALRYALHEHDAGDPAAHDSRLTTSLADFALEQWPGVRRTPLWAAHVARQRGQVSQWRRRGARAVFDLRWALRWQRRQRWGT